jgi:hypothetical protein
MANTPFRIIIPGEINLDNKTFSRLRAYNIKNPRP